MAYPPAQTGLPPLSPSSGWLRDISRRRQSVASKLIGVAADKEIAVTEDTLVALAAIIGGTLSAADIDEITAAAQEIHNAVVLAHDS